MLERILPRFTGLSYGLLRIVSGALFACHGAQKHFGWFQSGPAPALDAQMWIGGVIELVGGTLLALGLWTRWAAFIASGTMAVAYVQFHWKGQLGSAFFPLVNRGELALLYAFLFLYIACRGAGALSLDRMRGGEPRG